MNRKIFWAVIIFALGEVFGVYTSLRVQISTLVGVLILLWYLYVSGRLKGKGIVGYVVGVAFLLIGCLNGYRTKWEPDVRKSISTYEVYITLEGIVEEIEEENGIQNIVIKLNKSEYDGKVSSEKYKVNIYGAKELKIGNKIQAKGLMTIYETPTNPGAFDLYLYNKACNCYGFMYEPTVEIINEDYNVFLEGMRSFKRDVINRIYALADEKVAGSLSGIVIGGKKLIDTDIRKLLQVNGISHILAISGLHISIIGGGFFKLLRKFGIGYIAAGSCSILLMGLYGILTGNKVSTIRALIMLSISIWGKVIGSRYDLLTGMAIAFFVMKIKSPNLMFDGGFLLSFAAVFGVVLGTWICKEMKLRKKSNENSKKTNENSRKTSEKGWRGFKDKLVESVIFSLSITAVTLPLIIGMYFEVPVYSLLVNLIVIPLMPILIFSVLISLIVSCFSMILADILIVPAEYIFYAYMKFCEFVSGLPFNTINVGHITIWIAVLYYISLILLLVVINLKRILKRDTLKNSGKMRAVKKGKNKKVITENRIMIFVSWAIIVVIIMNIFFVFFLYQREYKEGIIFLDVGQGDGILIRTPDDINIVIDGGSSSKKNLGEYVLLPALKYMRMAKIDFYFVSHTDMDHISGLLYILENIELTGIEIENIILAKHSNLNESGEKLVGLAAENNIKIIYAETGNHIASAYFDIEILHPDESFETEDINDSSLVMSYESKAVSVLFTGDIGIKAMEEMILENNLNEKYDILKIPHHGSKNSIYMKFYEEINFELAVISCGKDNMYGHPADETLERLDKNEIKYLRTDEDGAVWMHGD